ncbi:helix-turn-helix domain containing protein [Amycolatopsis sp. cg5]|uniref:helix-turn-helix domain containing protein n=1 Tax=Amycolatopsis sp. cg5 TaxID=3238802 RepID=UPI0035269F8D
MNITKEHRTEIRVGTNTYRIEVAAQPSDDHTQPSQWVAITIGGADADGDPVAEGRLDLQNQVVSTVAELLAESLFDFVGRPKPPPRRRPGDRPAKQGQSWSAGEDAELEKRWLAGESVEAIAHYFERTPGGIRARLPRVGCDPENQGEYLPTPPSRRPEALGGETE